MPNHKQTLNFIFGKRTQNLSRLFHSITLKNNIYRTVASGLQDYRGLSYVILYTKIGF
jgi:hypothetical protein